MQVFLENQVKNHLGMLYLPYSSQVLIDKQKDH